MKAYRFVYIWAGRFNFVVPVISRDLHIRDFAYEYLTICEHCKHSVSLSRTVWFCAVKESILYSQLELVRVFHSLSQLLLSHLGVNQPREKEP